ncbi:MAG: hypothetical protein L3J19_04745 [Sulfurimonas sp.]|nr:hypothetical protein [Sulfurimonas sp.]
MARVKENKKSIELSDQKITFEIEKLSYKVIRFYPTKMTLDVMVYENEEKQGMKNIPFAHLPKSAKKLIKAN